MAAIRDDQRFKPRLHQYVVSLRKILNPHFLIWLICANAFFFHALSLFISFSIFFICTMHSAFNLFIFPNYMFTLLLLFFLFFLTYFLWKGYELSGEIALKNNHYYYYYYFFSQLSCEMSTRREHPRVGCLFSAMSFPDEVALKSQRIFYCKIEYSVLCSSNVNHIFVLCVINGFSFLIFFIWLT